MPYWPRSPTQIPRQQRQGASRLALRSGLAGKSPQSLAGTTLLGDIEYRGQNWSKTSGCHCGFVDSTINSNCTGADVMTTAVYVAAVGADEALSRPHSQPEVLRPIRLRFATGNRSFEPRVQLTDGRVHRLRFAFGVLKSWRHSSGSPRALDILDVDSCMHEVSFESAWPCFSKPNSCLNKRKSC
jgi:hypothetical protein